eukprot:134027_1
MDIQTNEETLENYQRHETPRSSPKGSPEHSPEPKPGITQITPAVNVTNRVNVGQHTIQPLSKNELLCGGISIIILMCMAIIFELFSSKLEINTVNVETEQDLIDFHNTIQNNPGYVKVYLLQSGLELITFPLYILYFNAVDRVFKVCFPEYYILKRTFLFSFTVAFILFFTSIIPEIMSLIFEYEIYDSTNNLMTSIYYTQLNLLRLSTLLTSVAVYFAAISLDVFWIAILRAMLLDKNYSNDLKKYMVPCKTAVIGKIVIILIIMTNTFGALIAVFAWNQTGFWSLTGGASMFVIFVILSQILSGVWLIWLAMSNTFIQFNAKFQFLHF